MLFQRAGCQTPTDKTPAWLRRPRAGERLSLQHDITVRAPKRGCDSKQRGSNAWQGNNSPRVSCYSRITRTRGEVIQVRVHQGNLNERRIIYLAINRREEYTDGYLLKTADVLQVPSLI